jgi:hypothetical protein
MLAVSLGPFLCALRAWLRLKFVLCFPLINIAKVILTPNSLQNTVTSCREELHHCLDGGQ